MLDGGCKIARLIAEAKAGVKGTLHEVPRKGPGCAREKSVSNC